MDDLWERVDLTQVGIPLPNRQNGSKLVFSTRSKDVCSRMHAQKKIEVECLAWDMAWKLFQEKVGEEPLSIYPDIPVLAETVAKECGGLPLALITIGRAMACKTTPEEWKYAIHMLKTSASEFSSMGDEVFPLLKFSYDSLSSDRVRSCFLYCALFPKDASIDINELIGYWVGEGLLDEYSDTYGAQDQGYSIIGTLVSACLLEKSKDTTLKMHDVIRDMALWIAGACSEAGHGFLVQTGLQLTEQPAVEKWNGVKRISLNNNFIESLSETPTCPNLLTLFLRNNSLLGFNDSFFELMPRLKVLDLSQNRSLTSLSPGISRLISLQYLNLSQTGIQDIPAELRSLVGLKYFNLFEATKLDIIPQRLISSFSMLQVLNMFNCGNSEIVVEECVQCGGNESLIEELQTLKHLYSLRLSIKSVSALNLFLASQKLQKCARGILLHHLRVLCVLDMSSFATVQHLDELCITVCENLEELVMDWALNRSESQASDHIQCSIMGESFLSLQHFRIQHCHKLRDLSWLIFAPNLKTLYIHACAALEEIVCLSKLDASKVVQHLEPFSKLKNIILLGLPSLKSIYLKPLTFRYLEEFNVFGCRELKKLPIKYGITEGCKMVMYGKEYWWQKIKWEDEATLNAFHHCFQAK